MFGNGAAIVSGILEILAGISIGTGGTGAGGLLALTGGGALPGAAIAAVSVAVGSGLVVQGTNSVAAGVEGILERTGTLLAIMEGGGTDDSNNSPDHQAQSETSFPENVPQRLVGASERDILSQTPNDVTEVFEDISNYRTTELNRPAYTGNRRADGVVARLDVGGESIYGYNSWATSDQAARDAIRDVGLRHPSQRGPMWLTGNHAEGHVLYQAQQRGLLRGNSARLFIDATMCRQCGVSGGVYYLTRGAGLTSLEVYERLPDGRIIRTLFINQ